VVADGAPQLEKRLAQAVSCGPLGLLGPQQTGQPLATVWLAGLHSQVGQEGTYFVVFEGCYRVPIQGNPEGAEQ
jgi:hypothetical protein